MPFDAFSAVQSLADGNRSFGDVVKDLSTAELADLREQVQIQLKDMPKNGDPARAERLQQLRTLLKGSVRSMIGTLAASLAFSKATGISLETTEGASVEEIGKQITAPETRTVAQEAHTKSTVSAFDKPAEEVAAPATAPSLATAGEKPALSFEDFKKMSDPKNEKNVVRNFFGYMSYRMARFIAKSSAKDGMLGKMFKKFGWDKGAEALTTVIELGPSTPPEAKKPPVSVPPSTEPPSEKIPPSSPPPSTEPVPPPSAPDIKPPPASVPPAAAPAPTLPVPPTVPAPTPPPPTSPRVPDPAPSVPTPSPSLFDGSMEGKNLFDGTTFNVDGHTMSMPNDKDTFVIFDGKKYMARGLFDVPVGGIAARALIKSAVMKGGELHMELVTGTIYRINRSVLEGLTKEMALLTAKTITTKVPVTMIQPGKPAKPHEETLALERID